MVCRVILEKARKLPSLLSVLKHSPMRKLRMGAFLGLLAGTYAFAANYNATVYHEGDLFYQVVNGTETVLKCTSAAGGVKFNLDSKKLPASEIQFFSDATCKSAITSVAGDDLFVGSQRATVTLNEDGSITKGKPAVASSSSAANPTKPVSSSSAAKDPVRPTSSSSVAPQKNGKKTIAFFTPWSNTNAVLFMNGDSVGTMTSLDNKCGWFQKSVAATANGMKVYFKQTVGLNYVGAEGMVQDEPMNATNIVLDTFPEFASADTIWIQGYKTDAPAVFFKFPGVLGDCPLKKFPVTLFDWLHGNKGDGDGAGQNGDPANGINADFGSGGCGGGNASRTDGRNTYKYMAGMVEKELGPNGVPVRANPFPTDCKITEHLDYWFLPESLAVDPQGNKLTNMTCRDLYISMDNEGFWLAEVSKDNISKGNEFNKGGMFLLDDFLYLDDAKTIKNPYYEQLTGTDKRQHNFGFTMKIQATFEYVPGQYFDFLGDDDVWVFINNKLAVDIGGQHGQVPGAVNLDTIGQNNPADKLIPGETYNFHIFYVERHTGSSNFKMRTSIDLKVDASIFVKDIQKGDVTDYEVWQVNKKNKLACGYDPNNTEVDTTGGASTFKLTGGNLSEPQALDVGLHYEGLNITSDSTFSVNVEAIKAGGALAPGHYFLEITLKSDPSQSTKVEITVPAYDIPSVAFAKTDWTILGTSVSGDTVQIGDFAYATYQVNITFFEEWAKVNNYNRKINLSFSDVNIDILDTVGGKRISYVNLDSNGRATFYVHANAPISNATLTAKGAAAKSSVWSNLKFIEPPIPRVVSAIITDRNGDGRADSLYVRFDRSLQDKSTLDSIQFEFGEAFATTTKFKVVNGTDIVAVAEDVNHEKCSSGSVCGFGSRQFTGGSAEIYTGALNNWFTYKDNGKTSQFYKEKEPIDDGVGPIIVKAVKTRGSDGYVQLSLTFSEAISEETRSNYMEIFEFICIRTEVNETPDNPVRQSGDGNTMVLIYRDSKDAVQPTNGDLVHFATEIGNVAQDLLGNKTHAKNPWVTITGDQDLTNESPGVIAVGADPYGIIKNDTITQTFLITNTTQDAQKIGDSLGVQGHLVGYDISEIMKEETKTAIGALDAFIESKLGSTTLYDTIVTVNLTEEEALEIVFSDIRTGEVGENFGLSAATVEAIMEGTLTVADFDKLSSDEKAIITKLQQDNLEASRDTNVVISEISSVTQADLFAAIREGKLDKELAEAGVSTTLIDAIKNGVVDEFNLEEYRNGSKSIIADDAVELFYRTRYYSQFGEYVGGTSKSIHCSDKAVYGEEGCLKNKGKIFLAWNMRSNSGRLVATGVYIARLEMKIIVNGEIKLHQTRDKLWGVRRGKTNELGLEF